MNKEELQSKLSTKFPELEFPEINSEYLNSYCPKENLLKIAEALRNDDELKFDFLFSLTAIDYEEDMEVIYHLRSSVYGHEMVLRVKTGGRENPEVETVTFIWPTAEFHEREVYDLFGIKFKNHPDLRRIFLEDDWEGFPLRKDYEDDINIVEL